MGPGKNVPPPPGGALSESVVETDGYDPDEAGSSHLEDFGHSAEEEDHIPCHFPFPPYQREICCLLENRNTCASTARMRPSSSWAASTFRSHGTHHRRRASSGDRCRRRWMYTGGIPPPGNPDCQKGQAPRDDKQNARSARKPTACAHRELVGERGWSVAHLYMRGCGANRERAWETREHGTNVVLSSPVMSNSNSGLRDLAPAKGPVRNPAARPILRRDQAQNVRNSFGEFAM